MSRTAFLRAAQRIRRLAPEEMGTGSAASPCNSICQMAPVIDVGTSWCLGCLRTLDEVAIWSSLDPEGRKSVWRALLARAGQLEGEAPT